MRQNKIIGALNERPHTLREMPYKLSPYKMSLANRERIRQIRVAGKRTNNCFRCGKFLTVYYLDGDEDRAVERFIEVNADTLARINLSTNSVLDSGMPPGMAQRIRAAMR